MDKKQVRFSIWYVVVALWVVALIQLFVAPAFGPSELSYSDFKAAVAGGKVEEVSISTATGRSARCARA